VFIFKETVCVYYCSTYYKAVRGGGGGWRGEDMCYERLRAEASVNYRSVCPSRTHRGKEPGRSESGPGWVFECVCFITAGPITKLFAWREEESGGHVL
jgi:hypothetical protein